MPALIWFLGRDKPVSVTESATEVRGKLLQDEWGEFTRSASRIGGRGERKIQARRDAIAFVQEHEDGDPI